MEIKKIDFEGGFAYLRIILICDLSGHHDRSVSERFRAFRVEINNSLNGDVTYIIMKYYVLHQNVTGTGLQSIFYHISIIYQELFVLTIPSVTYYLFSRTICRILLVLTIPSVHLLLVHTVSSIRYCFFFTIPSITYCLLSQYHLSHTVCSHNTIYQVLFVFTIPSITYCLFL